MKAFLVLVALLTAPAAFAVDAAITGPHTISNSQLRVLSLEVPGRRYQLHIGLPGNYQRDTTKRYAVVYVTDGYWDFEKLHVVQGSLNYDKVAPEFIIVGLGYAGENLDYGALRWRELSPMPFGNDPDSGHAADFLKVIEAEIIPLIDREYRTDPTQRVLGGASLGGLFTLYAMYTKPELFQGYMAVTPAVVLNNDWLLDYEDKFVKAGGQLKGRLFVSVGENEDAGYVGGILRYNSRVNERKHPGLAYQFRVIDGERHAGMQIESYVRAIRFVFAPLAPEQGPVSIR